MRRRDWERILWFSKCFQFHRLGFVLSKVAFTNSHTTCIWVLQLSEILLAPCVGPEKKSTRKFKSQTGNCYFDSSKNKAKPTKSENAQLTFVGCFFFLFSSREGNWRGGSIFFFFFLSWSFLNSRLKGDNKLISFKARSFLCVMGSWVEQGPRISQRHSWFLRKWLPSRAQRAALIFSPN